MRLVPLSSVGQRDDGQELAAHRSREACQRFVNVFRMITMFCDWFEPRSTSRAGYILIRINQHKRISGACPSAWEELTKSSNQVAKIAKFLKIKPIERLGTKHILHQVSSVQPLSSEQTTQQAAPGPPLNRHVRTARICK
jgi:hypothetical protein